MAYRVWLPAVAALLLSSLSPSDAFSHPPAAPRPLALRSGGASCLFMTQGRGGEPPHQQSLAEGSKSSREDTLLISRQPGCGQAAGRGEWSRRAALAAASAAALSWLSPSTVNAFDNRSTPKSSNKPNPGEPAAGVGAGVPKEGGTLAKCGYAPNCFSPYGSKEQDVDHYYAPWSVSKGREEALGDLVRAVEAYPPGQEDIDEGGWEIEKQGDGYLWVVFESGVYGYKDDLEFAIVKEGQVQVRSASRLGYTESGVNSKRINWFADYLAKDPAWKVERIGKSNYPRYFRENLVRYKNPQPQG